MKNLKKLKGAKLLSKEEQRTIKGGVVRKCGRFGICPHEQTCVDGFCV